MHVHLASSRNNIGIYLLLNVCIHFAMNTSQTRPRLLHALPTFYTYRTHNPIIGETEIIIPPALSEHHGNELYIASLYMYDIHAGIYCM